MKIIIALSAFALTACSSEPPALEVNFQPNPLSPHSSTMIYVTSLEDEIKIDRKISINRGKCVVSKGYDSRGKTEGDSAELGYSDRITFPAGCPVNDIKEVVIKTSKGTMSYSPDL